MLNKLVGLLLPLVFWACGGPCGAIADHREAFLNDRPTADAPHLSVLVPRALVDEALQSSLKRLTPASLKVPGLGPLDRYVDAFKLAPKRLNVSRTKAGDWRFELGFEVSLGAAGLFELGFVADAKPESPDDKRKLVMALRPDMLAEVKPSVSNGAVAAMTDALLSRVPKAARALLPKKEVQALAEKTVAYLSEHAFETLRKTVLTPMGELARVEFVLPDLPIADLTLTTLGGKNGVFRLDLKTSLPVATGLSPAALARTPTKGDRAIRVKMAAGTVMELANWAITQGKVPGRYNTSGKPDTTGGLVPGVAWDGGDRPLAIHLWHDGTPCMRVKLQASPQVALAGSQLKVGVDDVKVVEVEGPLLLESLAEVALSLWTDSLSISQKATAKTRIKAGGTSTEAALSGVSLKGDELEFSLSVGNRDDG